MVRPAPSHSSPPAAAAMGRPRRAGAPPRTDSGTPAEGRGHGWARPLSLPNGAWRPPPAAEGLGCPESPPARRDGPLPPPLVHGAGAVHSYLGGGKGSQSPGRRWKGSWWRGGSGGRGACTRPMAAPRLLQSHCVHGIDCPTAALVSLHTLHTLPLTALGSLHTLRTLPHSCPKVTLHTAPLLPQCHFIHHPTAPHSRSARPLRWRPNTPSRDRPGATSCPCHA